ncbi:JAB domain-containing protein [Cohnella caldifontis]|uniref:JAB domain-containing protein n=1 Tax=Cohnella caldifontis TaxID=3027471 RepID=UPI0023ECA85F|nr:JAB domain-containing protein [Cohnella sp. YIM B05605]
MGKRKRKRAGTSAWRRIDVVRLSLVRESSFLSRIRVETPSDAHGVFRRFLGKESDRELCALLCLDAKCRPTAMQIVSVGTLDGTWIHPREIYKTALAANAASIICAHSHPSGDPEPSPEDAAVTRRLVMAGAMIGIPLLDHLILGAGDEYVSMREVGRMDFYGPSAKFMEGISGESPGKANGPSASYTAAERNIPPP